MPTVRPLAFALLAVLAVPAAAQPAVRYVPIESYQGGDCGETSLPVCRVRRLWSPDTLRARLSAGPAVWRSGPGEVTFAYRGAATAVGACCSVQIPLSPLDGTDLWVLSVRVPDADRLVMTTSFLVQGSTASDGAVRQTPGVRWAGPLADPPPSRADPLAGSLTTDSLRSEALGGMRAVTVYLPPVLGAGPLPVVYLADGQSTEAYARVLEPAVLAGRVPPVALVGLHNAARERDPGSNVDGRSREYLVGLDSARYAAHERFFLGEVVPWAERTHGVSSDPADRAVFGFSNGASFAASMVRRHPERFNAALAFSHAYDGLDAADDPDLSGRRFFFVAGRLEPTFVARSKTIAGAVAARGADVHQEVHESGHDEAMWQAAFPAAVRWAFLNTDE